MTTTEKAQEYYSSLVDSHRDRYLIEFPKEQVSGPLVVYLHTGLATAEQGFCEDNVWCAHELRDEVIRRRGVYISPDYRGDSWMNAAAEADLLGLVMRLKKRFNTHGLVVGGTSMGGTSALIFAAHHPDLVDGVIALCPVTDLAELWRDFKSRDALVYPKLADSITKAYGGTPDEVPEQYAYRSSLKQVDKLTMPIALSHSDADEVVPVSHSRQLTQALTELGRKVRFDEISGGTHDSPSVATPWKEYLDFAMQNLDGE